MNALSKPFVWIDVTNAPHVLFFEPFIDYFKKHNIKYIITCRDLGGSKALLLSKRIPFIELGKHYGSSIFKKAFGTINEINLRFRFLRKNKNITLILTHQSPYAILSGYLFRKKTIEFFDNEFAGLSNYLSFPFASKLYCPESLRETNLSKRFLFKKSKLNYYKGIKEGIYLSGFKKSNAILNELNLKEKSYIVFRPEAYYAHYHPTSKNTDKIIDYLLTNKEKVLLVARDNKQKEEYRTKYGKSNYFIVLECVVDGPQLISNSKLVISAGGTMNREACVLGVPVISLYSGDLLEVDKWLINKGYMKHIKDIKNFSKEDVFFKTNKNKLESEKISKLIIDVI